MALTLTENLIRSRVNLTHENLEDIKSLSLPGTFHEKIVSIGTSLRKFSRLKSLDFSRNALESLQGLENLQLLEKLNLYYNNVSSIEELDRLKHNENLKEIDLRLNPVTRNEPDYRLYLIHMLPNLQKLDDRGVRDRERQAALTHFSTSQAAELVALPPKPPPATRSPNPRTEMMAKLKKGPSVLVDDDVAVIDVMNRNQGDFGKPRPLTGSAAKEDMVEDYSLDVLKMINEPKAMRHREKTMEDASVKTQIIAVKPSVQPEIEDPKLNRYKELYPNIMSTPGDSLQKIGDGPRNDPNLLFPDEVEANSKYRGQGYFTPNPEGDYETTISRRERNQLHFGEPDLYFYKSDRIDYRTTGLSQRPSRAEVRPKLSQDDSSTVPRPRLHRTNSVPGREDLNMMSQNPEQMREKNLLYSLLNLVDRYWNGSKSLHKHSKFIEQALKSLSEYSLTKVHKDEEIRSLRFKLDRLQEENSALRRQKDSSIGDANETELKLSLKRAKEDMERMHEEIRHYISENKALQKRLDGQDTSIGVSRYHSAAGASDSSAVNLGILDELQRQNDALLRDCDQMRAKLKQYGQLQELTSMLQESHRSLVETNDHLLHELHEAKQKHQQEIEQMHWSYDQLKSTMGYSSILPPSAHTFNSSKDDASRRNLTSNYRESHYDEKEGISNSVKH